MTAVSVEDEVEIRRGRRQVFAFVSDREHLPAWAVGVKRAKRTAPGPVGVGTTYRIVGRTLGRKVESTYEVTAYEPGVLFAGRMVSPVFTVEETYRFEGDDTHTKVSLKAEAQPGSRARFLWPLLALAAPRQVKADHKRLKKLLETRRRPPPTAAAQPAPAPAAQEPLREG